MRYCKLKLETEIYNVGSCLLSFLKIDKEKKEESEGFVTLLQTAIKRKLKLETDV